MSRTEELIRLAQQGDRAASEQLVNENSGLIWSVARRFIGRGAETDDLYPPNYVSRGYFPIIH